MDYSDWPHLAQMRRVERIVHLKGGTRREWACGVTTLEHQAGGLAPMRFISYAPATPFGLKNSDAGAIKHSPRA